MSLSSRSGCAGDMRVLMAGVMGRVSSYEATRSAVGYSSRAEVASSKSAAGSTHRASASRRTVCHPGFLVFPHSNALIRTCGTPDRSESWA